MSSSYLPETLRYKLEGLRLYSRWVHCIFSLAYSLWPHNDPGIDSASNKDEYLEYFMGDKGGRCVGVTVAIIEKFWQPQGPYRDCLIFTFRELSFIFLEKLILNVI